MSEQMGIIHWRSLATNATGHGTKAFPIEDLRDWASQMNTDARKDGMPIHHWVIEVKESRNVI